MLRSLAQAAWAGVRPMTLSMARSTIVQRPLITPSIMSSPLTITLKPFTWSRTESVKPFISANFSTSNTVQGQFAVNRKRKTARLKAKLKVSDYHKMSQ
jgi:hypothetical protein